MITVKHDNLGTVNKNEVTLTKYISDNKYIRLILTFSYQTCVSVELFGFGEYIKAVHVNDWSTTTGKLLNELEPDKKKRLEDKEFTAELERALSLFENVK